MLSFINRKDNTFLFPGYIHRKSSVLSFIFLAMFVSVWSLYHSEDNLVTSRNNFTVMVSKIYNNVLSYYSISRVSVLVLLKRRGEMAVLRLKFLSFQTENKMGSKWILRCYQSKICFYNYHLLNWVNRSQWFQYKSKKKILRS